MALLQQQKAAIKGSIVDPKAAKALIDLLDGIAATSVEVAAYVDGGVDAGDLQAAIEALADRITALEPE